MNDLPVAELTYATTRRGYWAAAGLFLIALGVIFFVLARILGAVNAMPRIEARGEHVVALPAGDLVVFGELQGGDVAGSLRCLVKDAAGSPLALQPASATTSYDVGSHHGRSLFDLQVPASGPVTVTCETDADLVLAFGEGFGKLLFIGVPIALLSGLAAAGVAVMTYARRRRARRDHQRAVATNRSQSMPTSRSDEK